MWVFSDPAKEVGLKKNSWRGVGWEGAAPPPQMHSQNMLRDSPSVRRILRALCSHLFCRFAEKHIVPFDSYVLVSCVHKSFGPL